MTSLDQSQVPAPRDASPNWRLFRLLVPAFVVVLAFVLWMLIPPWLSLLWAMIPRSFQRSVVIGFLNVLLVGYGAVVVSLLIGLVPLGICLGRRRSAETRRPWLARLLLLGLSIALSLIGLELGAAIWLGWLHRSPSPPAETRPVDKGPSLPKEFETRVSVSGREPLRILVIGESSGRGEPYHPWLSVGQIVGWKLEQIVPGREVLVDVWATGGASLEAMHQKLSELTYRPDVLLLFAGHNEFQARYAWSRNPPYYLDEQPARLEFPLIDFVLRKSPFCRLVLETLDRQRIDAIPTRVVTRQLVDRPTCTEQEAADLLAGFTRRLQAIAEYCDAIGTLPVFIIPGSNDGDYEPSRSVLPAETTRAGREAFAERFGQVRELETSEPTRAIAAYWSLLDEYPGFAETHLRLARLLERTGAFSEARDHYILAREYDAMPLRCPEPFRRAFHDTAARHPNMILVDCEKVLEPLSPHGILDDHLYHDAQHPTFRGYLALAQDLLNQICQRRALGWPGSTSAPTIDPDAAARHFGLDSQRWALVCHRSARFHEVTAFIRHDPTERQNRENAYRRAAKQIESGAAPESVGITGLGVNPVPAP